MYCLRLVVTGLACSLASTVASDDCGKALGMESGEIPNSALSASSSHDVYSMGPHRARLYGEEAGGAWCAKGILTEKSREYLEVKFSKPKRVTAVATQGRHGQGLGQEYVEHYRIYYYRSGMSTWGRYKTDNGEEILSGNKNTESVVVNSLDQPIVAEIVRFYPVTSQPINACMRVELYGCDYTGVVKSYSMLQGDHDNGINLHDKSYDGSITNNYLSGGLGQLTDSNYAESEPLWTTSGFKTALNWVGWSRVNHPRGVEIIFQLYKVMDVLKIKIYFNNLHSFAKKVFTSVLVSCSLDGEKYELGVEYLPEEKMVRDGVQCESIPVGCNASYLMVKLRPASDWMIISEITILTDNLTGFPDAMFSTTDHSVNHPMKVSVTPETGIVDSTGDENYTAVVLCIIIPLAVAAVLVAAAFLYKRKRRKKTFPQRTSDLVWAPAGNDETQAEHLLTPATPIPPNVQILLANQKSMSLPREMPPATIGSLSKRQVGSLPLHYSSRELNKDTATSDHPESPFYYELEPIYDQVQPPVHVSPVSKPLVVAYATSDVVLKSTIMQGASGNNVYSVTDQKRLSEEGIIPPAIPEENLKFFRRLGRGEYGEVNLYDYSLDSLPATRKKFKCVVAVKSLREKASEKLISEFLREAKIMSCLDHQNISKILGACSIGQPYMAVEYTELGDLQHYLKGRRLECVNSGNYIQNLSLQTLLQYCIQVSCGMRYLESKGFVHGDLATRNCLVGKTRTIKISNLAMSRQEDFPGEYYQVKGRPPFPIRWMPWEALFLGKCTSKSDVWSFGVTVWEILTLCEELPYCDLNDEDYISAFHNYKLPLLSQPTCCSSELYEVICKCFKLNDSERPTFREIYHKIDKEVLACGSTFKS